MVNRSILIIRNSRMTMIQTNMAMTLPPKGHKNKPVDNEQRAKEEKNGRKNCSITLLEGHRSPAQGAVGRPKNPKVPKVHIPNCILTSGDIKFGYFDSSEVPSSIRAKEYNIGGS